MLCASESHPSLDQTARRGSRVLLWGCVLILTSAAAVVGIVWYLADRQARTQLAEQIARLRAKNEPLTTEELNAFYRPAPGRPDMTAEIMSALDLCESPVLKPLADQLPIVGRGADPPPPNQPWPLLPEIDAYLKQVESAIAIFQKVAQTNGTARYVDDFTPGYHAALPNVARMRQGSRVLELKFHVHWYRNELPEAVECILAQIAFSQTMEQEPILVSQQTRHAFVAKAVASVGDMLKHPEVPSAELNRVQDALRRIDFQAGLKTALVGERVYACLPCRDQIAGFAVAAQPNSADATKESMTQSARVADAALILERSLRIADAADQSLLAALHEGRQLDRELEELSQRFLAKWKYSATLASSPRYRLNIGLLVWTAARRDCIDAAIAAELHRRKHGAWPTALEQLVPEFLPSVPIDVYADQPLKMIVNPSEITIYSVGPDELDDGGMLSDRYEKGTDLGVSLTTPSP
jgi:hypothetical protein